MQLLASITVFYLPTPYQLLSKLLTELWQKMCQRLHVTEFKRLYCHPGRHYHTLWCFHSPSMRCHSEFSVLSYCPGSALIPLEFSPLCSATILHYLISYICPHLPAISILTVRVYHCCYIRYSRYIQQFYLGFSLYKMCKKAFYL